MIKEPAWFDTCVPHLQANMDVMSWALCAEDYNKLCNLTVQLRMVNGSFWLHPKGPYVTMKDLWDEDNNSGGKANIAEDSSLG